MKLYRVLLIAVLASTLSVLGCNDDGDGGSNGGNGNGESGVCAECDVPAQIPVCESTYNACIQDDLGSQEDCVAAALLRCQGA